MDKDKLKNLVYLENNVLDEIKIIGVFIFVLFIIIMVLVLIIYFVVLKKWNGVYEIIKR